MNISYTQKFNKNIKIDNFNDFANLNQDNPVEFDLG